MRQGQAGWRLLAEHATVLCIATVGRVGSWRASAQALHKHRMLGR
jgi:hypothetical protein